MTGLGVGVGLLYLKQTHQASQLHRRVEKELWVLE